GREGETRQGGAGARSPAATKNIGACQTPHASASTSVARRGERICSGRGKANARQPSSSPSTTQTCPRARNGRMLEGGEPEQPGLAPGVQEPPHNSENPSLGENRPEVGTRGASRA